MMCIIPKLDPVNMIWMKLCQFVLKILRGNEILTDGMTDNPNPI